MTVRSKSPTPLATLEGLDAKKRQKTSGNEQLRVLSTFAIGLYLEGGFVREAFPSFELTSICSVKTCMI